MRPELCVSLLALPPLGILLFAVYREDVVLRFAAKLTSSALFMIAALTWPARDAVFQAYVLAGLFASLVGDLSLVGSARRWVAAGLGAFLLAHVAYLLGLLRHLQLEHTPLGVGALIGLVLLTIGGAALRASWPKLGKLAPAAVLYGLLLSTLTGLALANWAGRPRELGPLLLGLGLALFFVSDLSVARQRFVTKSFVNKSWGLPAYYAAQHVIAASVAFV